MESTSKKIEQLITIFERIDKRHRMDSFFDSLHPSSLPQNSVIHCTEKVQLKDQENDKIAKIQQSKEVLECEHKNLVDIHYKEIMEKGEEISHLKDHVEKLLAQVKTTKITKKELKKHLS